MGFSIKIKEDLMVASARHCCVCHRYKGVKLEIHHITPKEQGGPDTMENGIVLCFDCHSDAGHYNTNHPKGTKLSIGELHKHKEEWFENVKRNNIPIPIQGIEVTFSNDQQSFEFQPIFVQEITKFQSFEKLKKVNIEELNERIALSTISHRFPFKKIETTDDLIAFMNGEHYKKYEKVDPREETNPQPILFDIGTYPIKVYSYRNLSTCEVLLQIANNSDDVLEDYKLYLKFNNVIKADTVDKRDSFFDSNKYRYNTIFKNDFECEFIPEYPVLVQTDGIEIDPICFKPKPESGIVLIEWKLVARNYNQTGQIELLINPIIEQKERIQYVESPIDPVFGQIKSKFQF